MHATVVPSQIAPKCSEICTYGRPEFTGSGKDAFSQPNLAGWMLISLEKANQNVGVFFKVRLKFPTRVVASFLWHPWEKMVKTRVPSNKQWTHRLPLGPGWARYPHREPHLHRANFGTRANLRAKNPQRSCPAWVHQRPPELDAKQIPWTPRKRGSKRATWALKLRMKKKRLKKNYQVRDKGLGFIGLVHLRVSFLGGLPKMCFFV